MADQSSYTKGTSSETGLAQSDSGFRQVQPASPDNRASTQQAPGAWDNATLQAYVKNKLQARQDQQTAVMTQESFSQQAPAAAATPGSNPYGVQRQPWVFATFGDLMGKTPGSVDPSTGNVPKDAIIWHANPKSVDWKISQRGSEAKTKSGTVLHIWRDRHRKTDYDDPKITISFQSGNIMPGYANGVDPSGQRGVPDQELAPGLNNFYQFLQLVDSSKIKNGQANLIHILYRSRIFPSMVITGFFDPQSVVSFTDTSDQPFQISGWSATFTIYRTVPAYNDWSKLAAQFKAEFSNGDPFRRNNHPRPDAGLVQQSLQNFDPTKQNG